MTTKLPGVRPPYGLTHVVPDNAIAAWGARLIVTQDGGVDFVSDRQGADGAKSDKAWLFQLLTLRLNPAELQALLADLLRAEIMHTRVAEDFILHMGDELVIHANTNASAGYCYVTAWLTGTA
jgi:hypothetical protein